jgi:hypothetical protein
MKLRTLALAGLALMGATAAFAGGAPMASTPCLRNIDIWNFDAPNDRTLIVESRNHSKYKLSLIGTCMGLKFSQRIAFKTPGETSLSCLSRGDQIINHDAGMRTVCSITDIVPYTPAMQAADKAEAEAKKAAAANH